MTDTPKIALDFVPRSPHYAQFRLRSYVPLPACEVFLTWEYRNGDHPYERHFRLGGMFPDEPIVIAPPDPEGDTHGGLDIDALGERFKSVAVTVEYPRASLHDDSATAQASIDDIQSAWEHMRDAGVVERSDPPDLARAIRAESVRLDRTLDRKVEQPMRQVAAALHGVARQVQRAAGVQPEPADVELYVVCEYRQPSEGKPSEFVFVELEDKDGHGVGPERSGVQWRAHPSGGAAVFESGQLVRLGPFQPPPWAGVREPRSPEPDADEGSAAAPRPRRRAPRPSRAKGDRDA